MRAPNAPWCLRMRALTRASFEQPMPLAPSHSLRITGLARGLGGVARGDEIFAKSLLPGAEFGGRSGEGRNRPLRAVGGGPKRGIFDPILGAGAIGRGNGIGLRHDD